MSGGQKWARGGLVFGVSVSIAGNIANACLTDTPVSLPLRVALAVVWPAFLFVGVEVLVRNGHVRGKLARIGQGGLLMISIPTAITSYVNLHALMIKAAEPGIAQVTGPIGIDGLMLGCTIMLLATRTLSAPEAAPVAETLATQPVAPNWDEAWEELAPEISAPISPAPVSAPPAVSAPRAPRGEISPALRSAVSALISGDAPVEGPGASRSVIGRYGKVLRTLRSNPNAHINASQEKVKMELVDEIRAAMREVAPR